MLLVSFYSATTYGKEKIKKENSFNKQSKNSYQYNFWADFLPVLIEIAMWSVL